MRANRSLVLGAAVLAAAALALAGCGSDKEKSAGTDTAEQAVVDICGTNVSVYKAARILTGTAIIAGRQDQHGDSIQALFGSLIVGMLVNGIDFVALKDFDVSFADGVYTFKTGNDELGFRLYFAQDFGDFHANDPIPYNVFDVKSYVKNVDVSVGGSITDPSVDYNIDYGPLADLVDGDVHISGRDPRTLKIKLKVHTEAVGFAFDSVQRDTFEMPIVELLGLITGKWDYQVHMNSTPTSVADFPDLLANGGYGVSLAGSYVKIGFYFGDTLVQQTATTFEQADFKILPDADDDPATTGAYWEGGYTGAHETWFEDFDGENSAHLYESGLGSTCNPNYTEFYCDAARTQFWGRAEHNADLTGGVVTLANGKTLDYALEEGQTDDQRAGDDPTN